MKKFAVYLHRNNDEKSSFLWEKFSTYTFLKAEYPAMVLLIKSFEEASDAAQLAIKLNVETWGNSGGEQCLKDS